MVVGAAVVVVGAAVVVVGAAVVVVGEAVVEGPVVVEVVEPGTCVVGGVPNVRPNAVFAANGFNKFQVKER